MAETPSGNPAVPSDNLPVLAAKNVSLFDHAKRPVAPGTVLPAVFRDDSAALVDRAQEYFELTLPNLSTRTEYERAVRFFCQWASERGATSVKQVQAWHLAEFMRERGEKIAKPTVARELAALRGWFGYLTTGGFLPFNPAASVKGPKHSRIEGKTPCMTTDEAAQLPDSIDASSLKGKRDRAMIGLMLYSACRVGPLSLMKVEDFYQTGTRFYVNLHEKGGKDRTLAVHHLAAEYLHEWITAAGLANEPKHPMFPTMPNRLKKQPRPFTDEAICIQNILPMMKERCEAAGLGRRFTNHSCRATAITNLLDNEASREDAQRLAGHADARTTDLYDRRNRAVTQEMVEKISYGKAARPQMAQP